ncbi:MAG: putative immunity protein, partial [Candidatus Omnitrophota bacterium]
DWWDKKERNAVEVLRLLIKQKKYDWANWTIVRVMDYKQYVSYAVYAAKQVIDIYEKEYPDDKRPRQAIEAANKCIKNPSKKNKDAALAAEYAAYAANAANAAYAAAANAANAAAYAAYAANVEYAANAAAYAAFAAYAAAAYAANAKKELQLKILQYGIKLLQGG